MLPVGRLFQLGVALTEADEQIANDQNLADEACRMRLTALRSTGVAMAAEITTPDLEVASRFRRFYFDAEAN